MKSFHISVLILALTACASGSRWEKPGANQSAVDEDMQQCRVQAHLEPEPQIGSLSPYTMGTPSVERTDQRDARELQRFTKCMQDKGYSARR